MPLAQLAFSQVGTPLQSVPAFTQLSAHLFVQPSAFARFPSSHGSTPRAPTPSPHTTGTQLLAMQFLPVPQLLPATAGCSGEHRWVIVLHVPSAMHSLVALQFRVGSFGLHENLQLYSQPSP